VLGEWYETLNTFYRERRPDWERGYREAAAGTDENGEMGALDTRPLDPHAAFVLSELLPEAEPVPRPVAPESGTPLPLFVETEDQLKQAEALLSEFPAPEAPVTDDDVSRDATGEQSASTMEDGAVDESSDAASAKTERPTEAKRADGSKESHRVPHDDSSNSTVAQSPDESSGPAWSSILSEDTGDGKEANWESSDTASEGRKGAGNGSADAPQDDHGPGANLTDLERKRVGDIVALQPTKNGELEDRWDMASGSEVHAYLSGHLDDYYYRDNNSLIRATTEAIALVGDRDDDSQKQGDDTSVSASTPSSSESGTSDSVGETTGEQEDSPRPTDDGSPTPSEAGAGGEQSDADEDILDSIEDEFSFDI
jgi:hypothetical protein